LFFLRVCLTALLAAQDNLGALDTWVERAIAPRVLVDAVKQHCNLSYVGPLHRRDGGCNDAINAAMEPFNYVDIYDIYADVVRFEFVSLLSFFAECCGSARAAIRSC
jgi:hypothetical protein